jgi:hypothetical protein
MKQTDIEGQNLTGIDRMAIELLSNSIVDGERAEIFLPRLKYSAGCTMAANHIIKTIILKNEKSFCTIFYDCKDDKETIVWGV